MRAVNCVSLIYGKSIAFSYGRQFRPRQRPDEVVVPFSLCSLKNEICKLYKIKYSAESFIFRGTVSSESVGS